MKGQIIKIIAGQFSVAVEKSIYICVARKKLKEEGALVGDFVEFNEDERTIDKVYKRKNKLIRPPLANVEQLLIILAPLPKPDFYLIDKMLVMAYIQKIKPVIIINKIDICAHSIIDEVMAQYGKVCQIEMISALDKSNTRTILNPILSGKFSILAGQSAVGKTSILNALIDNANYETGELSAKIERGKNTTRHSELHVLDNTGIIADTPGFSALELFNITAEQVIDAYPEFASLGKCKFNNCNHFSEPENSCVVKQGVKDGKFNKERYQRYLALYKESKEKEGKKYG